LVAWHKLSDVVSAIGKATTQIEVVTTDNQNCLVTQSDVARTEWAVCHGKVPKIVCIQIVDRRYSWLHNARLLQEQSS
jgi:hypothetical protein